MVDTNLNLIFMTITMYLIDGKVAYIRYRTIQYYDIKISKINKRITIIETDYNKIVFINGKSFVDYIYGSESIYLYNDFELYDRITCKLGPNSYLKMSIYNGTQVYVDSNKALVDGIWFNRMLMPLEYILAQLKLDKYKRFNIGRYYNIGSNLYIGDSHMADILLSWKINMWLLQI